MDGGGVQKSYSATGNTLLPVQFGMLLPHLLGLCLHALDLDQRPLADSRAIAGRFRPGARAVHQLGPEWEYPALGRLGRMDPAAAIVEEVTVRAARHPQPHTVAGSVHILTLECGGAHPHELGRTHQVRLRQVDKPLLPATFGTSRLALKAYSLRHRIIMICNASAICDIFPRVYRGGCECPMSVKLCVIVSCSASKSINTSRKWT